MAASQENPYTCVSLQRSPGVHQHIQRAISEACGKSVRGRRRSADDSQGVTRNLHRLHFEHDLW